MVTIPEHMRAYQLIGHGGPEMLRFVPDAPTPKTNTGEVLIHLGAAGLNNTDINTRVGWYSEGDGQPKDASWGGGTIQFPRIQGADICGIVVEVGEGADTALAPVHLPTGVRRGLTGGAFCGCCPYRLLVGSISSRCFVGHPVTSVVSGQASRGSCWCV